MDATVVICTAGQRSSIEGTLRSLLAQNLSVPLTFEVVVVDNSQDDSSFIPRITAAFAAEAPVPVRYTRETQAGLGFARNAGIAASTGEIVAFVDDDVVVSPDWLSEVVTAYRETGAAAIGGRIEPIWEAKRPRWLDDDLLEYLSILDYGPERKQCHYPHYPFGANIAFQRDALEEAGNFATSLGSRGTPTYLMDETDLCWRLERAGESIIYTPRATLGHIVPASRLTRRYFIGRAAGLGRATARMWWTAAGSNSSLSSGAKGILLAAVRAVSHAIKALVLFVAGRQRACLSESRHLVWNLTWMWETGLLAVKGA